MTKPLSSTWVRWWNMTIRRRFLQTPAKKPLKITLRDVSDDGGTVRKKEYKKKDDIMVKFIESELTSLKKEVNEMWTLVYNQLDRAGESVLTFNRDLAQQVIVREKRVNAFELKIDSDVEDTIALYNPVAIDLRFVLAMFKINSDLERLGDFAEGIARFVVRSDETALDGELLRELRIEEMQRQVLGMLPRLH